MGQRFCAPPSAVTIRGQRNQRKTRHTTHLEDIPQTVRVVRNGHAFEGHELAVISRSRRGGQLHLLLSLPDQSRSLVPASWTNLRARLEAAPGAGTAPPQPLLATLEDLLKARNVIDTMLSRKTDAEERDDTA